MAMPTTSSESYPALPPTLLIISLKMYFSPSRTLSYLQSILDPSNGIVSSGPSDKKLLLALIPDFLTISSCASLLSAKYPNPTSPSKAPLLIGAQDCFWESSGAFTGEISPLHLAELGCSIVELGHAERRRIFHEDDAAVARKAAAVSAQGMIPLVCVGELSEPGAIASAAVGKAMNEIEPQVVSVLQAISDTAPVILAYEPVWAIGKPQPASVGHVGAVVEGIRRLVRNSGRKGDSRVLYGGSAGPGLWDHGGLGKQVDGMFLGRFAHEIGGLAEVVDEVRQTLGE